MKDWQKWPIGIFIVMYLVLAVYAFVIRAFRFFMYLTESVLFTVFLLLAFFGLLVLFAGIFSIFPEKPDKMSDEEKDLETANMLNRPWR